MMIYLKQCVCWTQWRLPVLSLLLLLEALTIKLVMQKQLSEIALFFSETLGPTWWVLLLFTCLFVSTVLFGWYKDGDLKAELEDQADLLRQMALVGTFLGIAQGLAAMGDEWQQFSQALNTSVYVYITLVVVLWLNDQVDVFSRGDQHGQ